MFYLIAIAGKLLQKLLRISNRGGGSLPGLFVLKCMPSFLRRLTLPPIIIMVTGTNGKSTVTNLLAKIMQDSNHTVIANLEGNNLKIGAVSLFLDHMDWKGRCLGDVLVLEVDELSVPRIMEDIEPTHLLIGNLFRDQLDRVGEMESVIRRFESCLETYSNVLLLNGDDPNVCRIALTAKQAKVSYFGVAKQEHSLIVTAEASEGKFCPICANELIYDYYQYSHIGRFHCLFDDFGKHSIAYQAKILEGAVEENGVMKYIVNDVLYTSSYDNLFAVYNEVEVIAIASMLGIPHEVTVSTIASFQMNNGRMEVFPLKSGFACVLNLAKNPTGINESLKAMTRKQEPCVFAMVLNDKDADGHDVSWIYDARFELVDNSFMTHLYTSGTRMYDMALRLTYANCRQPIVPVEDLDELVNLLSNHHCPVYVIANYTALQSVRKALQRGNL